MSREYSIVGRRARRRGVAFVEFAIVLPVLLAMLLGIIDFGQMGRQSLIIANAAREGARAAAVGQSSTNVRTRIINAGEPPLREAGGVISNGSIVLQHAASSTTPTYSNWPSDTTTSTGTKNGVPTGNYVRVTVNYNHQSFTGVFNRTISIPVVMRREG
jgi:Flp pilus assembly protein TadG